MKQTIVWAVVALVVAEGLYWWWSSTTGTSVMSDDGTTVQQDVVDDAQPASTSVQSMATSTATTSSSVTVTYDGTSFTPSTVTIHKGETVTFVDQSGSPMWVASNPHPVHDGYDGTTRQTHCAAGYQGPTPFDECVASTNDYTFTFDKTGSWGYHDHLNHSAQGTVVVQ